MENKELLIALKELETKIAESINIAREASGKIAKLMDTIYDRRNN